MGRLRGCLSSRPSRRIGEPVRLALHAMATRFELVLAGGDHGHLVAVGEEALAEVRRAEARWNLFARDSLLARIHRLAARQPVPVDAETLELLRLCRQVHAATGGAFDPTIAAWMRAKGLHRTSQAGGADPAATGMDGVVVDERSGTVRFARPGLALDFGAVGKGAALDLAGEVLREHRIGCALLHGGTSTVLAIGPPPGTRAFRILLGTGDRTVVAQLRDGALSVSAPHGRSVRRGGEAVTHVLDPRTGQPARSLSGAAVLHPQAAMADAWSTALLAGGTELLPACPGPALAFVATGDPIAGPRSHPSLRFSDRSPSP